MDQVNTDAIRLAIESKFNTLLDMTGKVQGLIVAGPPGIGKSYGIEAELEKKGREVSIVNSGLSPIGLYIKLWETRAKNFTLVIDDSDDILSKREGIDLLKAAFDTNRPRRVQWHKQNKGLADMGIPQQFEYDGHIIFITNLDLRNGNSKSRQRDFDTIISRVFYFDLEMNSLEAKLMRCQICLEGGMLPDLTIAERGMLFEYLTKFSPNFSEVSLRSLVKLSTAKTMFSDNWEVIAATTLMSNPPTEAYQTFEAEGTGAALIAAHQSNEYENLTLVENEEEESEHAEIKIFGHSHSVPKAKIDLIDEAHEETVCRIGIIDDFFLEIPFSKQPRTTKEIGKTKDEIRKFVTGNYYKKTLGLSQEQASELHDFILTILPALGKVDTDMLGKMVKFYTLSGGNWKQGVLALFVSKGVGVRARKKS